jgi:hypothetical protein
MLFLIPKQSPRSLLWCKTEDVALNKELLNKTGKVAANNKVFKTLRLAFPYRWVQYISWTVANALAAMNATMTRVNGVFNKDLAVKLSIIAQITIL